LSNFSKENLDVSFGMLEENLIFRGHHKRIEYFLNFFTESKFMTNNQKLVKIISSQIGVSNFKSNIQSHVVMGCKLSLFRYQVALVLRSTRWNELMDI